MTSPNVEQRDLRVYIANGTIPAEGDGVYLTDKYLKKGWRIVKVDNLNVGDFVGVTVEHQHGKDYDCACLKVANADGRVWIIGAKHVPREYDFLNDWHAAGYLDVSSTEYGSPPIGDMKIYAVSKR